MKRILIVNDCKFESVIIKDCLSDLGYSVQITNEYDVFMQIRKFNPDIVIANLIMKDTTGEKLIEYIKSINPKIVCLLSSCDLIKLEDFIKHKVDEVIHTPIDKLKLSQTLNKTLARYENSNSNETRESIDEISNTLSSRNSSGYSSVGVLDKTSTNEKTNQFSFCPYCGQKFTIDDQNFLFCPYCGHKIKN